MITRGARVLDVGCSSGAMSILIRDHRDAEVVGVEPNTDRASVARERGIEVHVGLMSASLLGTMKPFDFIIFADVLEHVPNPAMLLHDAKGALRPGGSIIASIPNIAHWSVRFELLRGRFDYTPKGIMDATHLRWFTAKTVRRLFSVEGLEIVDYRAAAGAAQPFYFEPPWGWMSRKLRDPIINRAARSWPTLFGFQHVVRAVPNKSR